MNTVVINNEILLQEMRFSSHVGATDSSKADAPNWPAWPVAPTGNGSSVNSNPSTDPVDPWSEGGNGGYLQQLSELMQELQANPTDLNLLPTLIELLTNCGNDPTIANDPEFQNLMSMFPVGANGQPDLEGLADVIVLMEFASTDGNVGQTTSFISQLLGAVGNSPFMSSFAARLSQLEQNPSWLNQFMQNGQLGYTDYDDLFNTDTQGQFIPCTPAQFFTYVGGLLGNDIVDPQANGSAANPFSSFIQAIMNAQMKDLLEELKKTKNVGEAYALLIMLVASNKDNMYQNQLSGLANTTQWLSGETGQVSSLISELNGTEFAPGQAGETNAKDFMANLIQLYESAKANPNASSLVASLKSALGQIFSTTDAGGQNTLLQDFQSGNYTALAAGLNAACSNLSTGSGLNILNSLKQLSQSFTNESQAVGTQIQAVSANDTQIVNFLKTALTDPTSGIVGAENAITSNQKTS